MTFEIPKPTVEVVHRETVRSDRGQAREIEFTVVVEFTPRHERGFKIVGNRWVVRRLLDGESPLGCVYNDASAKTRKEARQYVDTFIADDGFREQVKRALAFSMFDFGREV